jgi:hypothetical protein
VAYLNSAGIFLKGLIISTISLRTVSAADRAAPELSGALSHPPTSPQPVGTADPGDNMNAERCGNHVSRHVLKVRDRFRTGRASFRREGVSREHLFTSKCCHKVLSWSKGRLPGHDKGRVATEPIAQRPRDRRCNASGCKLVPALARPCSVLDISWSEIWNGHVL